MNAAAAPLVDATEVAAGDSTRWLDALTREDIQELRRMNDWHSWASLLTNWGLVFASLGMVAYFPNPLTILLALAVIGTRQLGLSVLMHEAAHRTLFKNRAVNDFVGNWLCGYPVWSDLGPYRRYHLQHHAKNWTPEDPDLNLATPFPVTWASMRRKIWRDLTGQTAWKRVKYTLRRDLGGMNVQQFGSNRGWRNLRGVAITNLVLLGALAACGHAALYLLWIGAWFTTHHLVVRLRSIAEHAMIPDPNDPLNNTRTTLARWWERLLIAPNCVNYHLEHHLVMTVPHYNLPRMHHLLRDRGVLDRACVANGYLSVLRLAASKAA
ncbi:MAG TPA: fatty acid desaturase family protein [Candidatus Margulisiibacteriota bacterium]|nr:fatty acid desaturase family protein [Candidatus Margulisiibacteriota bacterium]